MVYGISSPLVVAVDVVEGPGEGMNFVNNDHSKVRVGTESK